MEKRVLIIGSTGMLGHQVLKILGNNNSLKVFDLVYRNKRRLDSVICDVTNFDLLREKVYSIEPHFIVNCVGALIGGSQKSTTNAIMLNSLLPNILYEICEESGAKLIHISTDCVFSGKVGNYTESSPSDAQDIYGKSKALGEINSGKHITIRTSIVGPELKLKGEGLLHWFLTTQNSQLQGYDKVFWGGVTTLELAKAVNFALGEGISGVWNLTNGKKISKYQMLCNFNGYLIPEKQKKVQIDLSKNSDKSLKSERTEIGYSVPSYDEMFNEMFSDIFNNKDDYPHYDCFE